MARVIAGVDAGCNITGLHAVMKTQLESAFLAHFDQMDVNNDGILTAEERLQAR